MKILMIVDDLNIGGTGTHVLSISKQLLKHKIDVLVVSSYGELHNKFNENNIDVIYIDFSKDLYKLSFEIIDIIKENNIDVIHTHLTRSIEIADAIHKLINMDYISTLHTLYYEKDILNLLKDAKHVICVSEPIKDMLLSKINYDISNKVSVIYNAIEIKKSISNKKNKSKKIITYCSRLSMVKGTIAERVINEIYELAKYDENIIALIIGDGNKKKNIDFYANNINETLGRKAIYVLGSVYNPEKYFCISDCIIGTGRVLIEAINLQIGCISFGSNGFGGVVSPKNYSEMLDTYFCEHRSIKNTDMNLNESIKYILYDKSIIDTIKDNKEWCLDNFDEEKSIIKLKMILTN